MKIIPGLPVLHSKDLVNWTISIAAYQEADQWKEFFFIDDIESGIVGIEKRDARCPALLLSQRQAA